MRGQRKLRTTTKVVQSMASSELHAIAGHLAKQRAFKDLSRAQEWMWDQLVTELEWRHTNAEGWWERCWCKLCVVDPFPV